MADGTERTEPARDVGELSFYVGPADFSASRVRLRVSS